MSDSGTYSGDLTTTARSQEGSLELDQSPTHPTAGKSTLEHYIIPTNEYMIACVYYQWQHPVLVVPVEYFQKRRGTLLRTCTQTHTA